jgi:hypothetical protein
MRPLICYALLVLLTIGCKSTHNDEVLTKDQAHEMVRDFYSALSKGDSTLMSSLLSKDFVMYEHEVLWNQDSLLWLMSLTKDRIWRVDEIDHHANGDLTHIYYYNESDNPIGRSWYESMLFIREEDSWKIRFMQSTKRYLQ